MAQLVRRCIPLNRQRAFRGNQNPCTGGRQVKAEESIELTKQQLSTALEDCCEDIDSPVKQVEALLCFQCLMQARCLQGSVEHGIASTCHRQCRRQAAKRGTPQTEPIPDDPAQRASSPRVPSARRLPEVGPLRPLRCTTIPTADPG